MPPGPVRPLLHEPLSGAAAASDAPRGAVEPAVPSRTSKHRRSTRRRQGPWPWTAAPRAVVAGTTTARAVVKARSHGPLLRVPPLQARTAVKPWAAAPPLRCSIHVRVHVRILLTYVRTSDRMPEYSGNVFGHPIAYPDTQDVSLDTLGIV